MCADIIVNPSHETETKTKSRLHTTEMLINLILGVVTIDVQVVTESDEPRILQTLPFFRGISMNEEIKTTTTIDGSLKNCFVKFGEETKTYVKTSRPVP